MSIGVEGDMLVTYDVALLIYAWSYKNHGKNRDAIAQDVDDIVAAIRKITRGSRA